MPELNVIIPVYNERDTICEIIRKVKSVQLPDGVNKKIIVVDDCSVDGTIDILKRLNDENLLLFFHDKNMGKGAAIRTALIICGVLSGIVCQIEVNNMTMQGRPLSVIVIM